MCLDRGGGLGAEAPFDVPEQVVCGSSAGRNSWLQVTESHFPFHLGGPAVLSQVFLARLEAERAKAVALSSEQLESALHEVDAAGRAAWPNVPLEAETFIAHIGDRMCATNVERAVASLHAADLFLACACSRGIPTALAAFDRIHLSRVPFLIRRIDPSAAFADEVAQAMREALLVPASGRVPRIGEYSGGGALSSWVRVVAVRTAVHLRQEQRGTLAPVDAEKGGDLPGVVDPELDYLKLRYRRFYEEALRAALASLPDRDALLLKLHYVDGLNIDRIGAFFGVHRATVARWRTNVHRSLLASTREELRRRVPVTTASQFESLLALVRSQLVVSIRTALSRPGAPEPPTERT